MVEIKLLHIVSCSSELNSSNGAVNLLSSGTYKKWTCKPGEKEASVLIQLEKASKIGRLDIGNEHSAFVEVLVGRSSACSADEDFQVLLAASAFMTPAESRLSNNVNKVRSFVGDQLQKNVSNENWDRVKVVCTQPFNKNVPYGLSFIRVQNDGDEAGETEASAKVPKRLGAFALRADPSDSDPSVLFKRSTPAAAPASVVNLASSSSPATSVRPTTGRAGWSLSSNPIKGLHQKEVVAEPVSSSTKKRKLSRDEESGRAEPDKPLRTVPFKKLFNGVVVVLSGFQNPFRSELRDKACEMGARYKSDWDKSCTHLICAFTNTPKYNQVKGKGKIVKKEWILECHRQRKRLSWRKYALDASDRDGQISEEELEADSLQANSSVSKTESKAVPSTSSADVKHGGISKNGASDPELTLPATLPCGFDVDQLPELPDCFAEMRFCFGSSVTETERKKLTRCIVALGGQTVAVPHQTATHYVCADEASQLAELKSFAACHPTVSIVRSKWLFVCLNESTLVPIEEYLVLYD